MSSSNSTSMEIPLSEVESIAAKVIGPFLIGLLVNTFLFGAVYVQIYVYARTCEKDPLWRKLLVAVIFVLDALHLAFLIHVVWIYAIERNGNVLEFTMVRFYPFGVGLVIGAISISVTQVFFSWRVWRVSGNWWISLFAVFVSIAQLALTVASVTITAYAHNFTKVESGPVKATGTTFLGLDLITDVLNFGALAWYLHRRRGQFPGTNDVLSRLTRASIQTGAILVIWVTVYIILYCSVPNGTFFVFLMSMPNLYTNCLMSSLNARVVWGDDSSTASKISLPNPLPSMFRSTRSQGMTERGTGTMVSEGRHTSSNTNHGGTIVPGSGRDSKRSRGWPSWQVHSANSHSVGLESSGTTRGVFIERHVSINEDDDSEEARRKRAQAAFPPAEGEGEGDEYSMRALEEGSAHDNKSHGYYAGSAASTMDKRDAKSEKDGVSGELGTEHVLDLRPETRSHAGSSSAGL